MSYINSLDPSFGYYGPVDDGVRCCFHDFEGAFGHSIFGVECRVDLHDLPGAYPGVARQGGAERFRLVHCKSVRHGRTGAGGYPAVDSVDVQRDVDQLAVRQHFQRTLGHHHRSQLLNLFGLDKVYIVFVNQIVFRFFQVAHGHVDNVLRHKFRARDAHVFNLFPVFHRFASGIVHLTFEVVDAAGHREWHSVHVTCLGGVGRMDVGVCVDPDYAETLFRVGLADAGDRPVGRTMVAGEHQGEIIVQNSLIYFEANALFHDEYAIDEFGISVSRAIVEQLIYVFYLNKLILFKEVGVKVQARNFQGFHPQAGAPRTCTDLGLDRNYLQFFHTLLLSVKTKGQWLEFGLIDNRPPGARG